MTDHEFVAAIEEFKTASPSTAEIGTDICAIYKKVKPIIQGVLPFLKLIPVYGETIAEALTLLMSTLDASCSAAPAPSHA